MTEISSIKYSFYPTNSEGFASKSLLEVSAVDRSAPSRLLVSNAYPEVISEDDANVDLRGYYQDTRIENWMASVGNSVVRSTTNLTNAMVQAINNGYTVQDACNVKAADVAYKANARVFELANEISTFELDA